MITRARRGEARALSPECAICAADARAASPGPRTAAEHSCAMPPRLRIRRKGSRGCLRTSGREARGRSLSGSYADLVPRLLRELYAHQVLRQVGCLVKHVGGAEQPAEPRRAQRQQRHHVLGFHEPDGLDARALKLVARDAPICRRCARAETGSRPGSRDLPSQRYDACSAFSPVALSRRAGSMASTTSSR